MFCEKWNSFLQTDLGQQLVHDWRRHFTNAEIYFSNESVNDDFEDTIDTNDFPREDWMYLGELSNTQVVNEDKVSRNISIVLRHLRPEFFKFQKKKI